MAEGLESLQAAAEAATTTETPAEETATAPVADDVSTEATSDDSDTASSAEPEEDANSIIRYLDSTYKTSYGNKYKSDEDLLAAIPHLTKKLGERDQLAETGKRFQEHEAEFTAWLQSRNQPTPQQPAKNGDETPEWDPSWRYQITQDAQGNLVPVAGAPPEVVTKYRRAVEWREKRLDDIVRNPEKFADQALRGQLEKLRTEQKQLLEQEIQQTREQTAIQSWGSSVREKLFVSGDPNNGPSQLGQRFQEIYQTDLAEMPDGLAKLQTAYKFAAAELPKAKPPRKVPARASNQPPVSPGPQKNKTAEDYIREGMSMQQALMKEYEQQQAIG